MSHKGAKTMKWTILIIVTLTMGCATEFDTYWNLDEYGLNFDFEEKTYDSEVPGSDWTTRYIDSGDHGVTMYLGENDEYYFGSPYNAIWGIDYEEFMPGNCGPVAIKNLLRWYGIEPTIDEVAKQVKYDVDDKRGDIYAGCVLACAGELAICTNICFDVVNDLIKKHPGGTLNRNVRKGMKAYTPKGYVYRETSEDPSAIKEIIEQLEKGNPVLVSEVNGGTYYDVDFGYNTEAVVNIGKKYTLHASLLNGIEMRNGEPWVQMANSYNKPLTRFMEDWSKDNLGSDRYKRNAKRFADVKPFVAAWYEKKEE